MERARRIIAYFLAIVTGIAVFAAIASAGLYFGLFRSSVHKNLFEKHDIYTQIEKYAVSAVQESISRIGPGAPGSEKQREQLVAMINKAVTPEMVRMNVNTLIDGLFKYFSGDAYFLPDIYIAPAGMESKPSGTEAEKPAAPSQGQNLTGIDRISLSVLLMYMGRSDIIDTLSEIKLAGFALSHAPLLLLPLSACAFLPALISGKGRRLKVFCLTLLTAGGASTVSCLLLLVLGGWYLPQRFSESFLAEYISEASFSGYTWGLALLSASIPAAFGVLLPVTAYMIRLLPGPLLLTKVRKLALKASDYISHPAGRIAAKNGHMFSIAIVMLLAFASLLAAFRSVEKDFYAKDLAAALERLKGNGTYSRVIAARNEIIYSVEVRTNDKQTGDAVKSIKMKLEGTISGQWEKYSETALSDADGKARFNTGPGSYRLDFDKSQFPEEYKVPASYPFEIKTAGVTIITVHLEKTEGRKAGIAEILALGKNNEPLPNLQLTVMELSEGNEEKAAPGKVYSFTNQEGTAVFKLAEGRYTAAFLEESFPRSYQLPEPITIEVTGDATVKYSLKLSEKTAQTKPPKKKQ